MTKNVSTKDFGDNLVKKPIMATYDMLFSVVGINFGACETVSRIYEVWLLNITGNTTYSVYGEYDDAIDNGTIYTDSNRYIKYTSEAWTSRIKLYFDSSHSSIIYINSITVQLSVLTLLPCIKY